MTKEEMLSEIQGEISNRLVICEKNGSVECYKAMLSGLIPFIGKYRKRELYAPKRWALYENGNFVDVYESHTAAKSAKHRKVVEAAVDMLDLDYEIKPYR